MISLIVKNKPKSPSAEAYRTLRTNIQFSSLDKNIKTILVTSSSPSDGKSTTAANLAVAFAQTGKKVILLDCDMRAPSLHEIFHVSNNSGLTNMLIEDLKLEDVVISPLDNLDIIPCGTIPPNPSEILSSQKMNNLLMELQKRYDNIILDSPPVLPVTDAQILSTLADGVVFVVKSNITKIECCQKSKGLLETVKANILGIVINKIDIKESSGYYSYYEKK